MSRKILLLKLKGQPLLTMTSMLITNNLKLMKKIQMKAIREEITRMQRKFWSIPSKLISLRAPGLCHYLGISELYQT